MSGRDYNSEFFNEYIKAECRKFQSSIIDFDINRLHQQVEAVLMEQASLLSGIAWEDWFEVIVKGSDSDFSDSLHSALPLPRA